MTISLNTLVSLDILFAHANHSHVHKQQMYNAYKFN